MGQRGNYVIKSNAKTQIYYTHWRSIHVADDLMLGPEKYIEFIQGFEKRTYLTSEPWIESCVHIDIDTKSLLFWEGEDLTLTSVRRRYMELLKQLWKGWSVQYAVQEMYDIEAKMNIQYAIEQEYDYEYDVTLEDFKNEEVDDYETCIIVYIKDGNVQVKCSYDYDVQEFIFFGTQILEILNQRPTFDISEHFEKDVQDVMVIDCDQRKLIINYVHGGFKEKLANVWKDWSIDVGDYGYISILEKAGIDTAKLKMTAAEVEQQILKILHKDDTFDPKSFAENIMKKDDTAKFHPSFFENRKPSQTN
ncbi:hypothetical protein [uncultured Kordia sp.]|uniref:hypothetical protein n=1 Tax=uncultured Kordia sp. TaxID=507699 RepID=UPI0026215303|nr:hypothetical protein [uncultured Kordia sp.]